MIFHSLFLHIVISVLILTIIYNLYTFSGTHSSLQFNRSAFNNSETNTNLSQAHSRRKRFLIFKGAGVLKMVLGFIEPVNLLNKVPFRQVAVNYAFHIQYSPPTVPVYWWTYFYNSTTWSNIRDMKIQIRYKKSTEDLRYYFNHSPNLNLHKKLVKRENRQKVVLHDASRIATYKAIETFFRSQGFPGEICLLRTICEISQRSFLEGNYLQLIINAIFIPSVDNIDSKFLLAKQLGTQGAKCNTHWSCKDGIIWLQNIIKYNRK